MTTETQLALMNLLQTIVPPLMTFVFGWLLPQPKRMGGDQ